MTKVILSESNEPLKTIGDVRKDIGVQYEKYVKTDDYKNLFKVVKSDYPTLSDYLVFLSIFAWFREEYISKLPKRFKKEFIDLLKDGNRDPIDCKLNKELKGGELFAIKSYTKEEHAKIFSYLKPAKYVDNDGEEVHPFEIIGTEYKISTNDSSETPIAGSYEDAIQNLESNLDNIVKI